MFKHNNKHFNFINFLILVQILAILLYFNANIINAGKIGVALPLLATYFVLSIIIFIILGLQKAVFVRLHFFLFLLILGWVALRVAIDLDDFQYLKAITLGTTGGILLFYLVGAFFNLTYVHLQENGGKEALNIFIFLIFLVLTVYLHINFLSRMREDIFHIADLDGDYQRPGNFLSISFIIITALFTSLLSRWIGENKDKLKILLWFTVYSLITMALLFNSQLLGSNTTTAVISGIYILTVVVFMLMRNKKIQRLNSSGRSVSLMSKYLMKSVLRSAIIALTLFIVLLVLLIQFSGLDIMEINLFGFGAGEINSIVSRFEIISQSGINQMSYAPFLGNMSVSFHVTGIEGRYLHSFFLYIFSHLGLIGLLLVIIYFFLIFRQLYRGCKLNFSTNVPAVNAIMLLYFFLILLFLLLFANLATDMFWIVIWFAIGFMSQPFGFKSS